VADIFVLPLIPGKAKAYNLSELCVLSEAGGLKKNNLNREDAKDAKACRGFC
jgi:hypothetical protein